MYLLNRMNAATRTHGPAWMLFLFPTCIFLCMSVSYTESPIWGQSFSGLGDLPGGDFVSWAYGVSDDGVVVVGGSNSSFGDEAFYWTEDGGIIGMGDFPGGLFSSTAWGASEDGTVIVGNGFSVLGGEAFRWESGQMLGLGDLPHGIFASTARAVSDDGNAIAGQGNSAFGPEAFFWTLGDGMIGLGDLPGGDIRSVARGISGDGLVVVGNSDSDVGREAMRWTKNDGMVGLGHLASGDFSEALSASYDGCVIVGYSNTSRTGGRSEAFRWTVETGMVGLGVVYQQHHSAAQCVSADGSIVAGYSTSQTDSKAALWDKRLGMRGMRDILMKSYGLDLTGWSLDRAYGISADGQTIVGTGTNPAGQMEGWIATIGPILTECATAGTLLEGTGEVSGFQSTCASDDVYWQAHGSSLFFQITDPVVQFELTTSAPTDPEAMGIEIEASKENNNGNLNLRALMFNFTSGEYVALPDILSLATSDSTINLVLPGGSEPSEFIDLNTDNVKLLIQIIQTSGLPNVRTRLDKVLFHFR